MQVISIVVGDSRFDIVTFGSLNFSSSDTIVADPSHETNEKRDSLATQPLQSINAIRRYTVLFFLLYVAVRNIESILRPLTPLGLLARIFSDNAHSLLQRFVNPRLYFRH